MPKRKNVGPCSVVGCGRPIETKFMCQKHYYRVWKWGRTELVNTGKRSHPLYVLWFERKQRGSLCEAWDADFWAFASAVGDRPSPTHLLRRLTHSQPYGPGNWEWLDALKRQADEDIKSFNARKWAERKRRFPDFEVGRHLLREFGLTPEQYGEMFDEQNGVCAICLKPETVKRHKSDKPKAMAVDHCHSTGKVRGLLCWRCNTVLGKVTDSPDLLREMAVYLERSAQLPPTPS